MSLLDALGNPHHDQLNEEHVVSRHSCILSS